MAEGEHNRAAQRLAEILTVGHDPAACMACLDNLELYVAAQLAGDDYRARFPIAADHLDRCVECAEAYALTYDDLLEALQPAPDLPLPTPDFSFLEPYAAGALSPAALRRNRTTSLPKLIAAALTPLANGLRLQLSQAILAALMPPVPLALRDAAEQAPLTELLIPAPAPGIARLELRIYADLVDPARRDLRVRVELPDRDWPDLAGIGCTLHLSTGPYQIISDPWGEAVVTGIRAEELDNLALEIRRP
ncbi:MAG: hypothetical protein HC822_00705 [Oscillochloris sp.]|nr:hypothetical protein [Oscillochloris sp.]